MAKKIKKKKAEICTECGEKTENFYILSINSGKIVRCRDCYERSILQSVRHDTKYLDSQQIRNMRG